MGDGMLFRGFFGDGLILSYLSPYEQFLNIGC